MEEEKVIATVYLSQEELEGIFYALRQIEQENMLNSIGDELPKMIFATRLS